jgi:hypothetical protein
MIPGSAVPILLPVAAGGGLTIGQVYEGGYYAGTITYGAEAWLGGGTPTYKLVVAPKATGEASTTRSFKSSNTIDGTFQTATSNASRWDGYHNTYTSAVGTSGVHPAANYCQALNISSYTDWYLPSFEEAILAFGNLESLSDWLTGGGEAFNRSGSSYSNLGLYWSSTALSSNGQTAETKFIDSGSVAGMFKTETLWVRAIRRVAV